MKQVFALIGGVLLFLVVSSCTLDLSVVNSSISSSSSSSAALTGDFILSNQTTGNTVTEVLLTSDTLAYTNTVSVSAGSILTLSNVDYAVYSVRLTVQNDAKSFAVYVNYTNITVDEGNVGEITLEGATLTIQNSSQNILAHTFVINDTVVDLLESTNLSMGKSFVSPVELAAAPYDFIAVSADNLYTNTQNLSLNVGSGNTLTVSDLGTYIPPIGNLCISNATLETIVYAAYIYTNESSMGSNLLDSYGYFFLDPTNSATFTNYNAGSYIVKVGLSNSAYYEIEMKTSSTNTNALDYQDNTNSVISGGTTTKLVLQPAHLIIDNTGSTNDLYYFYLNDTNGFDLLNIVETNLSTGDFVSGGESFTNGFELVAGNYQVVMIGGTNFNNSLTNMTNLTLTPNVTNTFTVSW